MIKEVDVCIVGAGPAGMVLALLLAKQGVKVLVLEQHKDFEREYRGEVLMPRFVQMMQQLNLFSELEQCHHLKLSGLEGFYKDKPILRISMEEISPKVPFSLWMPQPILLDFFHRKAKAFPNYEIIFDASVKSLIEEDKKVKGVIAQNEHGEKIQVRAKITVGTDGRFSVLRRQGGFELADEDYHFDIVWFSIPRPKNLENQVRFFLNQGYNFLILPKYPDLVQCGLVVARGDYSKLRHEGIESIRKILLRSHPLFHSFAQQLKDFTPFSVLQAKIEYVKQWACDGAVLVGDSAHTCSPAGAIGVSVATASAIVAADVIFQGLVTQDYSAKQLGKLQEIREKEVLEIQKTQKAFTRILLTQSKMIKGFLPIFIFLAARLGIFTALQRKLLVMDRPLPVNPSLAF